MNFPVSWDLISTFEGSEGNQKEMLGWFRIIKSGYDIQVTQLIGTLICTSDWFECRSIEYL